MQQDLMGFKEICICKKSAREVQPIVHEIIKNELENKFDKKKLI